MSRKLTVLLLVLAMTLLFSSLAQAGEVTEDGLSDLLPAGMADDGVLTRGDFAVLLNAAAGLSPAPEGTVLPADVPADSPQAAAVKNLVASDILRGYPGGAIGIDQPVTRAQAAVFVSRTLGLPEMVDPGAVAGVETLKGHWAYRSYAWMIREGLMNVASPDGKLTCAEGIALLTDVFGSETKAREINEKSRVTQQDLNSMRMQGGLAIQMNMRDGAAPAGVPVDIQATADMAMDLSLEQGMHMVMTMNLPIAQQPLSMQIEQYYTPEGLFMKVTDPTTGKSEWQKMPDGLFPDFTVMMKQSLAQSANPVPAEIDKMFHYRCLGEDQVDGRTAYKVASYAQIKDLNVFIKMLSSQLGGQMEEQLTTMLKASGELIDGMSISGVAYIDKETYNPLKMKMLLVMGVKPTFMGEPMPIESLAIDYDLIFSDVNGDINIQLPEEAKNAPVMELPAAEPAPAPVAVQDVDPAA